MNKLKPYLKVKTVRSSIGRKIQVIAYGYKIIYLPSTKSFMIVHPSILCRIDFKNLKDAVLSAKMNEGTYPRGYIEFDKSGLQRFIKPKFNRVA